MNWIQSMNRCVGPVGPPSGYPKMSDGCCHKTVLERCKDCKLNMHGGLVAEKQREAPWNKRAQELLEVFAAPTPSTDGEKRLQGRIDALEAHVHTLQGKIMERRIYPANAQDKLDKLVGALESLCNKAYVRPSGLIFVDTVAIRKIIKENA